MTESADTELQAARERYAEDIREAAQVRSTAVVRAFATVPREHYLGPGPWQVMSLRPDSPLGFAYTSTPDARPVHLYRDVLVAIDPNRMLNNGQPSGHACWMDALDPRPGDHVVHIGCGTGYYTAILAEAVGQRGRVTAVERDDDLAARAGSNLAHLPHVRVVHGDGSTFDPGPANAVYVNAGATHPMPVWLDCLVPGGRLTMPLVRWPTDQREVTFSGSGVLIKITRQGTAYTARVVSLIGIFPCIGAVDADADRALADAFIRGIDTNAEYLLRRDPHDLGRACWLHGRGYCLTAEGAEVRGADHSKNRKE